MMRRNVVQTSGFLISTILCMSHMAMGQDDSPREQIQFPKYLLKMGPPLFRHPMTAAPSDESSEKPAAGDLRDLLFENLRLKLSLQQLQLERHAALTGQMEDASAGLREAIWQTREIQVSWENPAPENDQERAWVREAIEHTWQKECGIRFVGWSSSTADSKGIRILISDQHSHCEHLGRLIDGMPNGMVLNFTFANWCVECGLDRKKSIQAIAAHEFGHALGFAHEQNRDDRPDSCQKEKQGTVGDYYITVYDPNSIMNYCNDRWNNNGELSSLDIHAARILYGDPNQPFVPSTNSQPSSPSMKKPADSHNKKPAVTYQKSPPSKEVRKSGDNAPPMDLGAWLQAESRVARDKILANILSNGAVVASPSQESPNYYYHWVRDGALTMDVIVSQYVAASDGETKRRYLDLLKKYIDFSLRLQITDNLSSAVGRGLGEPKFHTDGSAYNESWGRPQDDGPAIRAASLSRLANKLLDLHDPSLTQFVKTQLYDSRVPTNSLIKRDLEYVSHNILKPCVDLWEEVYGHHFYSRIVQRRGLLDGASLARRLNDGAAADWYEAKANELQHALLDHWQPDQGYLIATFDQQGKDYKTSNLDIAIILGVLHARRSNDDFFSPTHDQVLATARKLANEFRGLYHINQMTTDHEGGQLGIAIGRYPEDRYPGSEPEHEGGGNPWYLCTAAMGELYYCIANEWDSAGALTVTGASRSFLADLRPTHVGDLHVGLTLTRSDARFNTILSALREAGDAQMRRVKFHATNDGALPEQFNRENGFGQSARDLTWSYAGVLTAIAVRAGRSDGAEPIFAPATFVPSTLAINGPDPTQIPLFARPLNRAGNPTGTSVSSPAIPNSSSTPGNFNEERELKEIAAAIRELTKELKALQSGKKKRQLQKP